MRLAFFHTFSGITADDGRDRWRGLEIDKRREWD
jgi:hypothetical protein